ncbi:hypothetical protein BH20ACI1_BH20ACI1_09630 [soil metagenome]
MEVLEINKIGSAVSPLNLTKTVSVIGYSELPRVGDVLVVKALSESVSYGNLELPSGRLAKINPNDRLLGVLGKRRALKGYVGDIPEQVKTGDRLHLLNMGGVIGVCLGHHSSLSDAIQVEVLGIACDANRNILNIADKALKPTNFLEKSAPVVIVAGTCMNSGKTVAATEIIKQACQAGLKVAGGKLTGVAALRDTLNMEDHGAIATASFLDCGLPSTVDVEELAAVAKAILNRLNKHEPDLIVVELGDGIIGGYAVDSILQDAQIRAATSAFVFCASDYVGVIGGIEILRQMGVEIDVIAGSVTDSNMGEDFVQEKFGINAGNARRDGLRLFNLIQTGMDRIDRINNSGFYPVNSVHTC